MINGNQGLRSSQVLERSDRVHLVNHVFSKCSCYCRVRPNAPGVALSFFGVPLQGDYTCPCHRGEYCNAGLQGEYFDARGEALRLERSDHDSRRNCHGPGECSCQHVLLTRQDESETFGRLMEAGSIDRGPRRMHRLLAELAKRETGP